MEDYKDKMDDAIEKGKDMKKSSPIAYGMAIGGAIVIAVALLIWAI